MILPTKHLGSDRCLLTTAGRIYSLIGRDQSVSTVWRLYVKRHADTAGGFDWFVLAIDLLYLIGLVRLRGDRITRVPNGKS